MKDPIPRLRMFAGPNGSGKTTVQRGLPAYLFENHINPDDIEKTIRDERILDCSRFGLSFDTTEVRNWFASSSFLKAQGMEKAGEGIVCDSSRIDFGATAINSYLASVLADAIRRKLIASCLFLRYEPGPIVFRLRDHRWN